MIRKEVKSMEKNLLDLKVKAIERQVKDGKEKGKKFLSFKVLNKVTGYYEELKFNRKTTKKPEEEGVFILTCKHENVNRLGQDFRDYPLTWIKDVEEINAYESVKGDTKEQELPF